MRIKVDEDLPKAVSLSLQKRGFDSASVIDKGMGGSPDAVLWRAAQDEGRFLVTADKGF